MTWMTRFWGSEYNICAASSCENTEHSLFLRWEVQEGDSSGRTELPAADQRWRWAPGAAGKPRPFPHICSADSPIKTWPFQAWSKASVQLSCQQNFSYTSRSNRITSVVQTARRLTTRLLKNVKSLLWKCWFVTDVGASPKEMLWSFLAIPVGCSDSRSWFFNSFPSFKACAGPSCAKPRSDFSEAGSQWSISVQILPFKIQVGASPPDQWVLFFFNNDVHLKVISQSKRARTALGD